MADARDSAAPAPIRLADYRPPDWRVEAVRLVFALDPARTIVRSRLALRRRPDAAAGAPIVLDGEAIELLSVALDGVALPPERFAKTDKSLTVFAAPETCTLEIETACAPAANTALSGLYLSNGMFCTQCEAEGFRRITYFPDRPDILAVYEVRIEADAAYPVLLSNGNPLAAGVLPDGRRFAEWRDPFPKPCYLFALVAGDLAAVEDRFTTRSGREVALKVFVQKENADRCGYTLDSLKRAMRWDEEAFGREYDLDLFMIVAVDHFNFGAMENKGLNIFNAAYVLASPETATDADYEAIESIVAHEYFHNWSGNRVTCRDWFQLCLKEGFTVFRDQEFSADMRSRAVQRIKDVRALWSAQFPEDAGPLAHPVRPSSYLTIDNFYTATVYEKGAELCRMLKTLLGAAAFRKGCDLYFSRHDGAAATVEDFVTAMEDASGRDLAQFWRWYGEAGTPALAAEERFDAASGAYVLSLTQSIPPGPGQTPEGAGPRVVPVAFALYGTQSGAVLERGMIEMSEWTVERRFGPFAERPVASLLEGFSAPVTLKRALSLADRLALARRDQDHFNRWAATDALWRDLALAAGGAKPMPDFESAVVGFVDALRASLAMAADDPALVAELLRCPPDSDLIRMPDVIDPEQVAAGRRAIRARAAHLLRQDLLSAYGAMRSNAPFRPDARQAGERALKNAALSLLVAAGDARLALDQAKSAANMTDEAAATAALAQTEGPEREEALDRFYRRWRQDSLVVNKWLAMNAAAPGVGGVDRVRALSAHEAFDETNPNRVRSLFGVFARENIGNFHAADGAGYALLVDRILATDRYNPQLAARLVAAFDFWRRLEPVRRLAAQSALHRITETKGVSTNLFEMAARLVEET